MSIATLSLMAQENIVKIFPFKSAIINYKYEAGIDGTRVLYIDDYGFKQAEIIKKDLYIGDNIERHYQTIILIGKRAYTADYSDSTLAIGVNSTYSYFFNNPNRTSTEISEALIKAEGFKLEGTKKYLGKECKYWKAKKGKKLTWNNIDLKSTTTFMIMLVEKATSIEVDVEIPSNIFEMPKKLKYISSDVYQGYSGLSLKFDADNDYKEESNNIKVSFNSSSLERTDEIPFYTQEGEELIQNGINDYNKIDLRIIKSQLHLLNSEVQELQPSRTLIFSQIDGYGSGTQLYGKIQINKLNKETYSYRYMIFDDQGNITGYSEDVNNALTKIFDISQNKSYSKLIFKPKSNTKFTILGW